MSQFKLFEAGERTASRQGVHTADTVHVLERDLKSCLEGLALSLFGKGKFELSFVQELSVLICFRSRIWYKFEIPSASL